MILLDTNAAYWALTDEARLGTAARDLIASSARRYVSALTHVEFTIKAMKGKLHVPPDLHEQLAALGLESLAFTERHSRALVEFPPLASHDPFDRMLLAQARVDDLTFLTADRRLLGFDGVVDAAL